MPHDEDEGPGNEDEAEDDEVSAATPNETSRRNGTPFALAVAVTALVLALTADERPLGSVADEQQILSSAVSLARLGEIGIGQGQIVTVPRPSGDAVPLYGLGLPLVQAPVVRAATAWERRFGDRSSQTLLAALQIALVVAAAALAGLLARTLGASPAGEAVAVAGAALGSPLGAYAVTGLTEPLQAVCLAGAVLLAARSVRAAGSRGLWLAACAGLLAGYAVLTKSVNLAVAPATLAPIALDALADRSRGRRLRLAGAAAAGAAVPLAAWLALEVARFGRPFGSHAGHGFSHPLLDGLWRLLGGSGQGLLLVFPLALLALPGLAVLARDRETRGSAAALALPFVALILIASTYWAWDGWSGWGPRYLVPALPLLAAAAGTPRGGVAHRLAVAAVVGAIPVNLLGLLQPDATASFYIASTGTVAVTEEEARKIPAPFVSRGPHGEARVSRLYGAAADPAFSAIRVHAFLLRLRLSPLDPQERRRRLEAPPWLGAYPDARPDLSAPAQTTFGVLARNLTGPFRWPYLGRATMAPPSERQETFLGLYDLALADQVGRKLDTGESAAARPLAEELFDLAPTGYSTALLAESLRASGRRDELRAFLDSQPAERRASPLVRLVEALALRDAGFEGAARAALEPLGRVFPEEALQSVFATAPSGRPAGLRDVLRRVTASGRGETAGS